MTKQDLIDQISAKTGLDPLTSRVIIEAFFAEIKAALIGGEPVYLRRFGSFILKKRAPKVARHIQQNTLIRLEARVIPGFKSSQEFTDQVRNQHKAIDTKN